MWRNLIKSFERTLTISPKQFKTNQNIWKTELKISKHGQRLFGSATGSNTETIPAEASTIAANDLEYIVPYNQEYEKPIFLRTLKEILRTKFGLSEEDAEIVISNEVVLKQYKKKSLMDTLETLCLEDISKNNIVEYPWLITLNKKKLLQKLTLLRSLHGFRDINDFVPLLRLQLSRLDKLVASLNCESNNISHGNRVYYIAEKLQLQPCIVTKYLAKRLFVLEMPLIKLKYNLKNMIDYKVDPIKILRDPLVFRYAPWAVESRLKKILPSKKNKIMPWMIICTEPVLEKLLQQSLAELQVLGKKSSVAEYIGERLGFSAEEAQAIMDKHPQVNTVRVTKIKEVLDYLLNEAKFTRYEIAQVPRILCHSLDTTKQRIEELKQYGCRPSSLVIVCLSKREYEKFLNQWKEQYNPNKSLNKAVQGIE